LCLMTGIDSRARETSSLDIITHVRLDVYEPAEQPMRSHKESAHGCP